MPVFEGSKTKGKWASGSIHDQSPIPDSELESITQSEPALEEASFVENKLDEAAQSIDQGAAKEINLIDGAEERDPTPADNIKFRNHLQSGNEAQEPSIMVENTASGGEIHSVLEAHQSQEPPMGISALHHQVEVESPELQEPAQLADTSVDNSQDNAVDLNVHEASIDLDGKEAELVGREFIQEPAVPMASPSLLETNPDILESKDTAVDAHLDDASMDSIRNGLSTYYTSTPLASDLKSQDGELVTNKLSDVEAIPDHVKASEGESSKATPQEFGATDEAYLDSQLNDGAGAFDAHKLQEEPAVNENNISPDGVDEGRTYATEGDDAKYNVTEGLRPFVISASLEEGNNDFEGKTQDKHSAVLMKDPDQEQFPQANDKEKETLNEANLLRLASRVDHGIGAPVSASVQQSNEKDIASSGSHTETPVREERSRKELPCAEGSTTAEGDIGDQTEVEAVHSQPDLEQTHGIETLVSSGSAHHNACGNTFSEALPDEGTALKNIHSIQTQEDNSGMHGEAVAVDISQDIVENAVPVLKSLKESTSERDTCDDGETGDPPDDPLRQIICSETEARQKKVLLPLLETEDNVDLLVTNNEKKDANPIPEDLSVSAIEQAVLEGAQDNNAIASNVCDTTIERYSDSEGARRQESSRLYKIGSDKVEHDGHTATKHGNSIPQSNAVPVCSSSVVQGSVADGTSSTVTILQDVNRSQCPGDQLAIKTTSGYAECPQEAPLSTNLGVGLLTDNTPETNTGHTKVVRFPQHPNNTFYAHQIH